MGAFETNSGKVGEQHFKDLLWNSLGHNRPEMTQGPQFGVDTAVLDLGGGQGLAISSDPLSLIPSLGMEVSAWLSIHLLINDMATTGFSPQYAQFVLNLPSTLSKDDFKSYWNHIHLLCDQHEIAITGGHTGQIPGQESTISGGGTMFLHAPLDQILTSKMAKAGDIIIMTKSAALSSTSLLAMAFPETVANNCGEEIQQSASENFWKLSSLKEALIAKETLITGKELRAMHDVTEGGILGAVYEMSKASGCGFRINKESIVVTPECQPIAQLFEIDPLRSIGAGSMLMAVDSSAVEKLLHALTSNDISAQVIGELTKDESCHQIDFSNSYQYSGEDPYWAAFFNAIKKGWK